MHQRLSEVATCVCVSSGLRRQVTEGRVRQTYIVVGRLRRSRKDGHGQNRAAAEQRRQYTSQGGGHFDAFGRCREGAERDSELGGDTAGDTAETTWRTTRSRMNGRDASLYHGREGYRPLGHEITTPLKGEAKTRGTVPGEAILGGKLQTVGTFGGTVRASCSPSNL
jgi:hypothetical protein